MARTKIPGYAQPSSPSSPSSNPVLKWVGIAAAVLVTAAVILALVLSEASTTADLASRVEVAEVAPKVDGDALPVYVAEDAVDPAAGSVLPTITGVDVNGDPMTISAGDGPQVIAVVAHWCSHCQVEVPLLSELVASGEWPEEVGLTFISTSQEKNQGNWPPSRWFDNEGISSPVLVDDSDATAAQALGTQGFPFLVAVAADGRVAVRSSGELGVDALKGLALSLVPESSPPTTQNP